MDYPRTLVHMGQVPRGATLPHWFLVEGIGKCLVKFFENPQGHRALINEIIGFGIADVLGLEHPPVGVVNIIPESLGETGQFEFVNHGIYAGESFVFKSGLGFYSKWLDPKDEVMAEDLTLSGAVNTKDLAGIVLLDLLINNQDRKPRNLNLILHRESNRQHLKLIDLGMAFGNANWELGNLQDTALPPLHEPLPYSELPSALLAKVNPMTDFQDFFIRMSKLSSSTLAGIIAQVPKDWGLTSNHKDALIKYVLDRAACLPDYMKDRISSQTKKWWE